MSLLESRHGSLAVHEVALGPRDHGHWTIEGARTPQFEQHLRAVLDYPLGETALTAPAVATALVRYGRSQGMGVDERLHHLLAEDPGVRVHLYGRPPRRGNVIGHVTALGDDLDDVRRRARRASRWLADGPAGHPVEERYG